MQSGFLLFILLQPHFCLWPLSMANGLLPLDLLLFFFFSFFCQKHSPSRNPCGSPSQFLLLDLTSLVLIFQRDFLWPPHQKMSVPTQVLSVPFFCLLAWHTYVCMYACKHSFIYSIIALTNDITDLRKGVLYIIRSKLRPTWLRQ